MKKSRETQKSLTYALPFPKHPRTLDSSLQSSCAWLPATCIPRALLRGMLTLPGGSQAHWGWPQGKEHMDRGVYLCHLSTWDVLGASLSVPCSGPSPAQALVLPPFLGGQEYAEWNGICTFASFLWQGPGAQSCPKAP